MSLSTLTPSSASVQAATLASGASTDSFFYDLLVIGGGSGGLAAAIEAGKHNKKVVVFDRVTPTPMGTKWGVGGTCINVGCLPKKLMHQSALLGESIHDAILMGWAFQESKSTKPKWESLIDTVQHQVKHASVMMLKDIRDNKVEYINALAHFVDSHTIAGVFDDGASKIYTAKNILIACGGRPSYPDIPGAREFCITSDDLFSLKKPPGNTLIVGSGYVAMECAGLLNGLGFETTVMVKSSVVLETFDQQMSKFIVEEMKERGVKFLFKCEPILIKRQTKTKLYVKWKVQDDSKENNAIFNTVLLATGRTPATAAIKADQIGLNMNLEGQLIAPMEQTNIKHIYAIGSVLDGRAELTRVAIGAAKLLVGRIFKYNNKTMSTINAPMIIHTPLEYAFVGLTEEESIKQHGTDRIEVYHAYYKPLEFMVTQKSPKNCYLKAICIRQGNQKVIGLHFLGPQAAEVIQGFVAAMNCGLTYSILSNTVGVHPTLAEEFTRLFITKRSGVDPTPQSCCS